jgi:hypothetical protein
VQRPELADPGVSCSIGKDQARCLERSGGLLIAVSWPLAVVYTLLLSFLQSLRSKIVYRAFTPYPALCCLRCAKGVLQAVSCKMQGLCSGVGVFRNFHLSHFSFWGARGSAACGTCSATPSLVEAETRVRAPFAFPPG